MIQIILTNERNAQRSRKGTTIIIGHRERRGMWGGNAKLA